MKRCYIFTLFVCMVVWQLAFPIQSIWQYEIRLKSGTRYKFKTAPVDPFDALRGRYVILSFPNTKVRSKSGVKWAEGDRAYVTLKRDKEGFVRYGALSKEAPVVGDYLQVSVHRQVGRDVYFDLPFDRFYMEESVAADAERAYREHTGSGNHQGTVYVSIMIKDGKGVIEDLYINDQPILEFLRVE